MLVKSAPAPAESAPAAPAKKDDGAVDVDSLGAGAAAAAPSVAAAPKPFAKDKDKDDDKKDDAKKDDAKPADSVAAAPSAAPSPPPAPAGSVGDLTDEMRKRVGASDKPDDGNENAAAAAADAKQQRPSLGAVQGALGAVRGAAKSCLGDDIEAVTHVSVVFQSDGSVKSVSLSGGAAGKPAEACVRSAVMKARVAPFNDPSYSASFTIRP